MKLNLTDRTGKVYTNLQYSYFPNVSFVNLHNSVVLMFMFFYSTYKSSLAKANDHHR